MKLRSTNLYRSRNVANQSSSVTWIQECLQYKRAELRKNCNFIKSQAKFMLQSFSFRRTSSSSDLLPGLRPPNTAGGLRPYRHPLRTLWIQSWATAWATDLKDFTDRQNGDTQISEQPKLACKILICEVSPVEQARYVPVHFFSELRLLLAGFYLHTYKVGAKLLFISSPNTDVCFKINSLLLHSAGNLHHVDYRVPHNAYINCRYTTS